MKVKILIFRKLKCVLLFSLICNICFSQSYLGTITKQVNLRSDASSYSYIIKSLKPGSQVFISSLETETDYYNVIDIATDKEGFVKKSFVDI